MTFVSYAQNFEDVMLWRAFSNVGNGFYDVEQGFYIDVGAWLPETDSVTRAFYERGWRGINVEPVRDFHARLCANRPRDINLRVAAGERPGCMTFHVIGETGLSTGDAGLAGQHRESGFETTEEEEIEVMTLAEICRRHAAPIIHFLKIDVEGMEEAVLRGADFINFRPRIVLLEATSPNSTVPTHEAWEPFLLAAGYRFLWFDGLNRFYAAAEQYDSMAPHFQVPPNVFDRFVRAAENRLAAELARAQTELAGLRERIAAAGSAASPPGA